MMEEYSASYFSVNGWTGGGYRSKITIDKKRGFSLTTAFHSGTPNKALKLQPRLSLTAGRIFFLKIHTKVSPIPAEQGRFCYA